MNRPSMNLPLDGDADALAVQRVGLDALRRGDVLTPTELGSRAGLDPQRVNEVVAALLRRESVTVTDEGRIDGIAGLTVRPTRHQLTIDGQLSHTWCAFDSVGIPAALGMNATAVTSCGHCQDRIEVQFTAGKTASTEMWGWLPALGSDKTQLITEFCSAADLFCSRDHLDRWYVAAGRPEGEALPIEDLMEAGRATWAHCTA